MRNRNTIITAVALAVIFFIAGYGVSSLRGSSASARPESTSAVNGADKPSGEASADAQTEEAQTEGAQTEPAAPAEDEAILEYWSEDSAVAASIKEYVAAATDPESAKFVPEEDRIAVFDLDGTIIGELYPSYFEYMMFIHRALYDDTYEAPEDVKTFAQALEIGIATGDMPDSPERFHAIYAGRAYAGMTIEEFNAYVKDFMGSKADGFNNLTRGEAFYWPMVSLVKYLAANDFQVYIVSGSDRLLVRALIEDWLPIPENRVIGMSYSIVASGQGDTDGLDYLYAPDDEVIRGGDLVIKTIKMNKVTEIAQEIGKVPVLSFGNSSGDLSMAQYVVSNDRYEGKAYMVLCDDLERELGSIEKANSLKETCDKLGFETISMRDDFATIYGDDVTITSGEAQSAETEENQEGAEAQAEAAGAEAHPVTDAEEIVSGGDGAAEGVAAEAEPQAAEAEAEAQLEEAQSGTESLAEAA